MRILLTGATGFIGSHIATALRQKGHTVVSVSRRQGVDFSRMTTAAYWFPYLHETDAVINCVGIIGETGSQRFATLHTQAPIALFQASVTSGVRRIIQISALGADESAFSAYHRSKRAADDYLRTLDVDWFVLRPSLVYGEGGASTALFTRLSQFPVIAVPGKGDQKLQPIAVEGVVAKVLECLETPHTRRTLDVAGAEIVTLAEWLQTLRRQHGRPPARIVPIPWSWVMTAAHLFHPLHPMLHPDNLRMLQAGSYIKS